MTILDHCTCIYTQIERGKIKRVIRRASGITSPRDLSLFLICLPPLLFLWIQRKPDRELEWMITLGTCATFNVWSNFKRDEGTHMLGYIFLVSIVTLTCNLTCDLRSCYDVQIGIITPL